MKIRAEHPQYEKFSRQWQRCRDLMEGSDAVKAGGYLPMPAGMSREDFSVYRRRAQYVNFLSRTVEALAGAVLYRPARITVPQKIEEDLKDLTLGDEPFEVMAQWLVTELLAVGRAGILLDMAAEGGKRPYWVPIRAESIINWRTGRVGDDPSALVQVIIRADRAIVNEDEPYEHEVQEGYRELALVDGVYQVRMWAPSNPRLVKSTFETPLTPGDWMTPMRLGKPLDFMPFTFVSTGGVTPAVTKPPLIDLVDVSIGHYLNSADHEHGLYLTALPTPWHVGAKGDGAPLKIGPSVSWDLGENGSAGMLEFSGAGLGAILTAMETKKQEMAVLGARLLESAPVVERDTATAVKLRHSGESATLRTISHAASTALGRVLRWHAWWRSTGPMPTDVEVHLHDEFLAPRLTADELRANMEAVLNGLLSEQTFFHNAKQGGWMRPGVSFEDEQRALKPAPVGERTKRRRQRSRK